MENTSIPSNICNFNSIECNGTIRSITHNTKIPKSTESIISSLFFKFLLFFIFSALMIVNYKQLSRFLL